MGADTGGRERSPWAGELGLADAGAAKGLFCPIRPSSLSGDDIAFLEGQI